MVGISVLGVLLWLGAAGAEVREVPGAVEEPAFGEQIVVTAARLEQRRDEVPAHVTVIEGEALARSPGAVVDEVLGGVSGFGLFRRASSVSAHPTTQGASLRGVAPSGVSRVLVLLDGLPLNDDFGGWVAWGKVSTEGLERVEVVPGGGSQVWGNQALGGVIQLVTVAPAEGQLRFAGRVGERSERSIDLGVGERWRRPVGALGASLGVSLFETGGYPVIGADQRGAIDLAATSEHETFSGRLRFEPGVRQTFELRARHFSEERGNGTPLTGNATDGLQLALSAGWGRPDGILWEGTVSASDQRFRSTFSAQTADRSSERPALDQFRVDSESLALSLQGSRQVGERHRLSLGLDARMVEGATHEDFRNLGGGFTRRRRAGGEQELAGFYVQDVVALGEGGQAVLGLRLDRWRHLDGARHESDLASGATTRDDRFDDRDRMAWSPRLALRQRLGGGWSWHGATWGAFRAPTLNELYRPFRVGNDITEANPELDRERLWGAEMGFERGARRGDLRLTVFWNRLDDPVVNVTVAPALVSGVIAPCGFVPAGGSCRQRRNLDRSRVRGFELDGRWRPGRDWRLEASYLWSDGEVVEAPEQPALEGRPLAQVPEQRASLGLIHRPPGRLGVALQVRWQDGRFEDDLGTRRLADALVVDLRLDHPLPRGWEVFAGVENLLDEVVESGRNAAGLVSLASPRRMFCGFRWSRTPP